MKKILLTGGSGFIGRNLKESSLALKYQLIAPTHGELDLADTQSVDDYFKNQNFDVVLHTATKPSHRNAKDPTNLFYTNVRMFENLERHKDKFDKLINFGSGAIYDVSANNADVTEEMIFKRLGRDDHSFCKYVVAKQIEKLDNFIDLNIFGIFGKYEDYAIRFISNAICKALFGLPITLRQNRRFSYLDVNDLPQILEFFIENHPRHKSYNITPDSFVELADIAKIIQTISPNNIPVRIAAQGYGLDYYGSNKRLKAELQSVAFTPINRSVEKLYAYYAANKNAIDKNLLLTDK
ncbi:MAG: NAD(P)-dependent oxidoreductase [Alphaproteobacteria bacterium]|nr:NAD(P)-dependent oxidoreductase [Alphaproteobacteria bacterium]